MADAANNTEPTDDELTVGVELFSHRGEGSIRLYDKDREDTEILIRYPVNEDRSPLMDYALTNDLWRDLHAALKAKVEQDG